MPTYLLANQCILLGIVNSTRAIVYRVVPNFNNKNFSLKIIIANQKLVYLKD